MRSVYSVYVHLFLLLSVFFSLYCSLHNHFCRSWWSQNVPRSLQFAAFHHHWVFIGPNYLSHCRLYLLLAMWSLYEIWRLPLSLSCILEDRDDQGWSILAWLLMCFRLVNDVCVVLEGALRIMSLHLRDLRRTKDNL